MATPKKNEAKQDFLKRCTAGKISAGKTSAEAAFKACNLDWDNANSQRAALNLNLPDDMVEFFYATDESDVTTGEFLITAYTGKVMPTWFGDIVIDVAGIEAKDKIPVLREHARDRVVGFGKTSKDKNNFYVGGDFSKTTYDAIEVKNLADEGYPWQASIAVRADQIEVLKDDKVTAKVNGQKFSGPLEIWRQSQVGEVSFVTLGRDDDTAGISLADTDDRYPVTIQSGLEAETINLTKEDPQMEITIDVLKTEAPELLAEIQEAARDDAFDEGYEEGTDSERARVSEILTAQADPEMTLKAIKDGVTAEAAYKLFYEAEVAKRAAGLNEMAAAAPTPLKIADPDEDAQPKTPEQVRAAWRPKLGPAAA